MDLQPPPNRREVENYVDRLLAKVLGHPFPELKQKLKPALTQLSHDLLLLERTCLHPIHGEDVERTFGLLLAGIRDDLGVLDDIISVRTHCHDNDTKELGLISDMLLHYASLIRWLDLASQPRLPPDLADETKEELFAIRDRFFRGVALDKLLLEGQPVTPVRPDGNESDDEDAYDYGHFLRRLFQGQESRAMGNVGRAGQSDLWRVSRALYWLDASDCRLRNYNDRARNRTQSEDVLVLVDLMKSIWLIMKVQETGSLWLPRSLSSLVRIIRQDLLSSLQQLYSQTTITCPQFTLFDSLSRQFQLNLPWSGHLERLEPPAPPPYPVNAAADGNTVVLGEKSSEDAEPQFYAREASESQLIQDHEANVEKMALIPIEYDTSSGLHVATLEFGDEENPHINSFAKSSEIEIQNSEYEENWFTGLETRESTEMQSPWIKSRVKLFKSEAPHVGDVRIWIERSIQDPLEVILDPEEIELVPTYAFPLSDQQRRSGQIHLRKRKECTGDPGRQLQYRFDTSRPENTQLYSFQAGLLGSFFEGEFPVNSVRFYRQAHLETCALSTMFQIWTERALEESKDRICPTSNPAVPNPLGRRHTSLDFHFSQIPAVKMFFFLKDAIYVLFISDLIELRKSVKKSRGRTTITVTIIPRCKENVKSLRVRRLTHSNGRLPGIPLNGAGIRYQDQHRDDLFHNYDSISMDFESGEDCYNFQSEFEFHLKEWTDRRSELEVHQTWMQIDRLYAIGDVGRSIR